MELILVVVISAGIAGNSQNGVSRSLRRLWYIHMEVKFKSVQYTIEYNKYKLRTCVIKYENDYG